MRIQRLIAACLLVFLVSIVLNILDRRLRIKYPSGITIVQVISEFKNEITGKRTSTGGAGFFIDARHIATNSHVVEFFDDFGRHRARVSVFDGKHSHPAKISGLDGDGDIALLEILSWCDIRIQVPCSKTVGMEEITGEVTVYPAPPSQSLIGSWFGLVFNPELNYPGPDNIFGARLLRGRIVGFEDWMGYDAIKHTSGIVPGYSGTPLLDQNNCYIGMNLGYDPLHPPISYAIPNNYLQRTFSAIKDHGYIERAFLGMIVKQQGDKVSILAVAQNGPTEFLERYKIPAIKLSSHSKLNPNGTFSIFSVNSVEIKDVKGLWRVVQALKVGNPVKMVFKDMDGSIYNEDVSSVSRFNFLAKYSFVDISFNIYSNKLALV